MVKLMLNNRGFTLIEVIFSISVIIILSLFTLSYACLSPVHLSIEQQCNQVISLLQDAKTQALLNHQKIDIIIENNQISYNSGNQHVLKLDENYYFENSFELYFNKNGNINSGNTLKLCDKHTCKSIVFNVGSGAFYVKE